MNNSKTVSPLKKAEEIEAYANAPAGTNPVDDAPGAAEAA